MRLMAERCSVDIYLYRAALFDMDGVITDTMPLHYESWKRAFSRAGVGVDKMDVYLREGMTSMAMAMDIAAAKGRALTDDEVTRIVDEKTRLFGEMVNEHGRAYDGVKETLLMLRNNGVALALVTGSRRESVDAVLKKAGLEGAFGRHRGRGRRHEREARAGALSFRHAEARHAGPGLRGRRETPLSA